MLDSGQKRLLRESLVAAFDSNTLDLFLQDWLDKRLDSIVPPATIFPMQCQLVILEMERSGRFVEFLQAIQTNHTNVALKAFVARLIETSDRAMPVGGTQARPYIVNRRPVLDRTTFWQRLTTLVNGGGGDRVLIVNGGVGKTYSRWPMSYLCDPSRNHALIVSIDVNVGNVLNVDGVRLANLIAARLWGNATINDVDELAQSIRVTKDLGGMIIQRLAALSERTWLIIDELNLVNLDESAIDLLQRLCQAIDGGECPHVWLFLFGLDPGKLSSRVGRFLPVDLVQRPSRQDIEDYMVSFTKTIGKPRTADSLAQMVDELDALLLSAPDHSSWERFHEMLSQKCSSLVQ